MRLTNVQHTDSAGNNIGSYVYQYDPGNRLTSETDNGTTTSYQYDTDSELTQAGTATYGYDANGNRTNTGYTTGTGNELTNDGTWTYTYNNEGNLTKKSKGASAETWTYAYDSLNHLVSAKDAGTDGGTTLTLVTYVYDVLGNRIEEDAWTQSGGTTTVSRYAYDGSNVWADLNGSNALTMRRLYLDGVDQPFARIDSSGNAGWYLQDHLGSTRDIENYAGTMVLDHLDYDAYGSITNDTNSANGDRMKYAAGAYDSYTGLEQFRERWYDPKTGRWTSQDPLGFAAGDNNLYRYVNNNAVNLVDPTGLEETHELRNIKVLINDDTQGYMNVLWTTKSITAEFYPYYKNVGEFVDHFKFDHLNWYQVAIEDTDPPTSATTKKKCVPPYIDPPAGGYEDVLKQWEDDYPWFNNEVDPPKGRKAKMIPEGYGYDRSSKVFRFTDSLRSPNDATVVFKTWLVALDKDKKAKQCLTGFTWKWTQKNGQTDITDVKALKDPPSKDEYDNLLETGGFSK
jgi:RHS repeat-associated protein